MIILVQEREYLYSLQHKDYGNHFVKDSFCKEIAGEVHAKGNEQAARYFVRHTNSVMRLCDTTQIM